MGLSRVFRAPLPLTKSALGWLCDNSIIQAPQLTSAGRMLLLPQAILAACLWTCEWLYPAGILFIRREALESLDSLTSPLRCKKATGSFKLSWQIPPYLEFFRKKLETAGPKIFINREQMYTILINAKNILLMFAFVFLSDTSGDIQITQALTSITKKKGSTAFLECQIRDILTKDSYIHWYRQKRDQALKRILSISSDDNVIHEQGVSGERYEARKHHGNLLVSLRIHRVEEADAGLYYCACWVQHTV